MSYCAEERPRVAGEDINDISIKAGFMDACGSVASARIYAGAPLAFVLDSVRVGLNKQHFFLCISGRMCETFSLRL